MLLAVTIILVFLLLLVLYSCSEQSNAIDPLYSEKVAHITAKYGESSIIFHSIADFLNILYTYHFCLLHIIIFQSSTHSSVVSTTINFKRIVVHFLFWLHSKIVFHLYAPNFSKKKERKKDKLTLFSYFLFNCIYFINNLQKPDFHARYRYDQGIYVCITM